MKCSPSEALHLLRASPPFAAVAVRELWVDQPHSQRDREVNVAALAEAAAGHLRLSCLLLQWLPLRTGPHTDALIAAAVRRKLSFVYLVGCSLSPDHLPALTELLTASLTLEHLWISNSHAPLFVGDGVPAFCAALRSAPALSRLTLCCSLLWHVPATGSALLRALRGRPLLRELDLSCNEAPSAAAQRVAGEALAALLAAPGGRLEALNVDYNNLGDTGMRPLAAALRGAQSLRRLIATHNNVSPDELSYRLMDCLPLRRRAGVARGVILPAVRANASLRALRLGQPGALTEAEAIVAARSGGRGVRVHAAAAGPALP